MAGSARRRRHVLLGLVLSPWLMFGATARAAPAHVFSASTVPEILDGLGIGEWRDGPEITLETPDVAENGALVPVEAGAMSDGSTRIRRVVLIAEDNPLPLLGDFRFEEGVLPWVDVRVKLAKSTHVSAYAEVSGHWVRARRFVQVIAGGCG